ncbi:hypothetical protein RSAG8_12744, partial [Rhizoctonia solani AG-8 WAC10335]
MYEEFDDWEYIPNNNWVDNSVFILAILSARDDPLDYFAYTSQDPNDWVNDLLDAIHMTIKPRWSNNDNDSDWGSNTDWGVVQSTRWGKPNHHVRRKMGPEWTKEQERGFTFTWTQESHPIDNLPEWEGNTDTEWF